MKDRKTGVDPTELAPYMVAGWQLIPLHNYAYHDSPKGKRRPRGKSPIDNNWTKRPYISEAQIGYMKKQGNNVGVRLRPGDLVIDVDPRNFVTFDDGTVDDPFKRLCLDHDLDPSLYPTVITGSGGLHVYMTKPEDVPVVDTLPDYEGVEFKTIGRQVVAAGSVHPETLNVYRWDFLTLDLMDAPPAPDKLTISIRRPTAGIGGSRGGEHDQEELAAMLDVLDPENFRDHDQWLTLMQACHHATGGDGRQEFVEWCIKDPEYTDHSGIVGRRWDSLHADSDGPRVTHRTLHKFLMDAGQAAVIPGRDATDDFEMVGADEDLPFEARDTGGHVEPHERKSPLDRMNGIYIAVMEGSKFRVMYEVDDPMTSPPQRRWVRASLTDFHAMLSNRSIEKGDKKVPISEEWMKWGKRRTAKGVVFDPERSHKGFLNLWTGWGVEARSGGSWARLESLLRDNLCDGDSEVAEYILDWSAYMVQHPGSPAEVAICIQGGKGIGKSTWGRALGKIAGRHGRHFTSSIQLTGRFNDHLRDAVYIFADEAVKAYDRDAESRLKGLITEPNLSFEGKGRDMVQGRNMVHILMCSNDEWVIPAGMEDERRFMLTKGNTGRVGQTAWFGALHRELENGGYAALLWDLMHRDLGNWAPRDRVPTTAGLIEQKVLTMGPIQQWWYNILQAGILPFSAIEKEDYFTDWQEGPIRAFHEDVKDSYVDYCRGAGIKNPGGMGRSLASVFTRAWGKMVPGLRHRNLLELTPEDRFDLSAHSDGRARAYEIPCLGDCRGAMEDVLAGKIDWAVHNK